MKRLVVLSALAGFSLAVLADTVAPVAPTTTEAAATAPTTSSAPSAPGSTTTTTVATPSDSKFWAFLELRPTYQRTDGKVDTEDTIELGYQFNKNTKLSYAQFLKTELLPSGSSIGQGVNLRGDGGFLRMRVNNIYVSQSKETRLSYQGRIYTPTYPSAPSEGFVGTLYNGLALAQDFGPVTLTVWEVPMLHAYSRNGNLSAKLASDPTKNSANPIFQNRVMVVADINITKSLLLSIPIIFDASKNRQFVQASNSEKWEYNLWAWPELDYTINDTHMVGLAYRTSNLVTKDMSSTNIANAFKSGVWQLVWGVTL